ncbi:hypothetical protein AB0A73_09790 [Glycomyces sp. NPDC047369]
MAEQRKFDPEAAREFQRAVREKILDPLEDSLMPMFKGDGLLGREPRFGQLESAGEAKGKYSEYHSATWQALEQLRKNSYGMLQKLDESIEANESAEDGNVGEMQSYEGEL